MDKIIYYIILIMSIKSLKKNGSKLVTDYTKSFSGTNRTNNFFKSAQLILGAILAGYTAQRVPASFMKWASNPIGQIIIYFFLFNQSSQYNISKKWLLYDAILFTVLINIIIYFMRLYEYRKNHRKNLPSLF